MILNEFGKSLVSGENLFLGGGLCDPATVQTPNEITPNATEREFVSHGIQDSTRCKSQSKNGVRFKGKWIKGKAFYAVEQACMVIIFKF